MTQLSEVAQLSSEEMLSSEWLKSQTVHRVEHIAEKAACHRESQNHSPCIKLGIDILQLPKDKALLKPKQDTKE